MGWGDREYPTFFYLITWAHLMDHGPIGTMWFSRNAGLLRPSESYLLLIGLSKCYLGLTMLILVLFWPRFTL